MHCYGTPYYTKGVGPTPSGGGGGQGTTSVRVDKGEPFSPHPCPPVV